VGENGLDLIVGQVLQQAVIDNDGGAVVPDGPGIGVAAHEIELGFRDAERSADRQEHPVDIRQLPGAKPQGAG
jgi:hypothetical protein